MTSIKYLVLKNYGLMTLNYYIEIDNDAFSVNEDNGVIGVGEEKTIKVEFSPKKVKYYNGKLRIASYIKDSDLTEYNYVYLTGKGSYPELTIDRNIIDFGVTFLEYTNKAAVCINNHGEPDVILKFKCYHPRVSVDPECEDENGNIIAYSNSITTIRFIYVPQIIETLDASLFLLVVDDEKQNFCLKLKAVVSVPKFSIYPESIYESLDFGTCLINKNTKKKFIIKNEGNSFLKYQIKYKINKVTYAIKENGNNNEVEIDDSFKSVFYVVNSKGKLNVNEEKKIIVLFKPKALYVYHYDLIFSLPYKEFSIPLIGTGGKFDIDINLPSNTIDLGTCKINQTFVYILPILNNSNMGVNYHIRPEPPDGDYTIYNKEMKVLELQKVISPKENFYNSLIINRPNSSFKLNEKENKLANRPETAPSYNEEKNILNIKHFEKEKQWVFDLKSIGLSIVNPDGYCEKLKETNIILQYTPLLAMPINTNIRVYYGHEYKDITVVGKASCSMLSLYDENNNMIYSSVNSDPDEIPTYDIGVISINTKYTTTFYLKNEGEFGINFFIQPITISEFLITPQNGFIPIGGNIPINIKFMPKTESIFKTNLKIFWENKTINILLIGKGNVGQLNIYYPNLYDREAEELDFQMIPVNTSCEKNFFIINRGIVTIPISIELINNVSFFFFFFFFFFFVCLFVCLFVNFFI